MSFRSRVENIVKNYTEAEIKVREATSNDPWYPSSSLMSEIANLTNNKLAFSEIMAMIWKRLNDHGKNWRHVYKSLILLDYLIKTGSEALANDCQSNVDVIKTLEDFHYRNQDGCDQGVYVQRKAKELVTLLSDSDKLKQERTKARMTKERIIGIYPIPPPKAPCQPTEAALYGDEFSWSRGFPSPFHSSSNGDEVSWSRSSPSSFHKSSPHLARSPEKTETPVLNWPCADMDVEMQLQIALRLSMEEHQQEQKLCHNDVVLLQKALETKGGAVLNLVDVSVESSEPPHHSDNNWHMSEGDVWPDVPAYLASSDPWVSLAFRNVNGRGENKASPSPRTCQISEAFLGPTTASLVNLDRLIPTNPPANRAFLSSLSAPSPTNPFLTEQPKPTLNKICSSSSSTVPPYSASLPLPMSHHQPTSLPSSHNQLTQPNLDMRQALWNAPWNNVPNSSRISAASPANPAALGGRSILCPAAEGPTAASLELASTDPTDPPANPPANNNNLFL